jgi:hypothetical protein
VSSRGRRGEGPGSQDRQSPCALPGGKGGSCVPRSKFRPAAEPGRRANKKEGLGSVFVFYCCAVKMEEKGKREEEEEERFR